MAKTPETKTARKDERAADRGGKAAAKLAEFRPVAEAPTGREIVVGWEGERRKARAIKQGDGAFQPVVPHLPAAASLSFDKPPTHFRPVKESKNAVKTGAEDDGD